MFDMSKMMEQFKGLQDQMKSLQEEVAKLSATGEAGAGMVKVTVSGERQLLDIEIDESIVSKDDREMLQDLVVAATNAALQNIEEKIKTETQQRAQGLFPGLSGMPGMNFGG